MPTSADFSSADIGGFLLAGTGIQGALILSVLMYGIALWAILTIRSRIPRAA